MSYLSCSVQGKTNRHEHKKILASIFLRRVEDWERAAESQIVYRTLTILVGEPTESLPYTDLQGMLTTWAYAMWYQAWPRLFLGALVRREWREIIRHNLHRKCSKDNICPIFQGEVSKVAILVRIVDKLEALRVERVRRLNEASVHCNTKSRLVFAHWKCYLEVHIALIRIAGALSLFWQLSPRQHARLPL